MGFAAIPKGKDARLDAVRELAAASGSMYGDGEVPAAARPFHRALVDARPDLSGLTYAVFSMGDRSYSRTYSQACDRRTHTR